MQAKPEFRRKTSLPIPLHMKTPDAKEGGVVVGMQTSLPE
jgi:hypothetical protein